MLFVCVCMWKGWSLLLLRVSGGFAYWWKLCDCVCVWQIYNIMCQTVFLYLKAVWSHYKSHYKTSMLRKISEFNDNFPWVGHHKKQPCPQYAFIYYSYKNMNKNSFMQLCCVNIKNPFTLKPKNISARIFTHMWPSTVILSALGGNVK